MSFEDLMKQWLAEHMVPMIQETIRKELARLPKAETSTQEGEMLTAKESAEFIGDALATFYTRTSRGEIATYGSGKRIFCKKSELIAWKEKQRTSSRDQIHLQVAQQLKKAS